MVPDFMGPAGSSRGKSEYIQEPLIKIAVVAFRLDERWLENGIVALVSRHCAISAVSLLCILFPIWKAACESPDHLNNFTIWYETPRQLLCRRMSSKHARSSPCNLPQLSVLRA